MALRDVLPTLARVPVKYIREVAPGVHAFGSMQPMSRVRAYQTNVLSPIGGRGSPTEVVLVGHVHADAAGRVQKVEGFIGAGAEGREWARGAFDALQKAGLLAEGAVLNAECPSNGCPYGNVR